MKATLDLRFEAIGTAWSVEVYEAVSALAARQIEQAVMARIEEFDRNYSRFRPDSLVAKMAAQAGDFELPADAEPLFDIYHQLYQLTDGRFTPLIGQALSDAGYDTDYSLKPRPLVAPPAWEVALDYKFPQLSLRRPALLDVGAAGKGYLVDLVSELVESFGLTNYCVDAGGDMRHRGSGSEPMRVGLEHPADPAQVVGVVELTNASLCGSAGNRRAWGEYHHILNPQTLSSPRHIQAVWVTAATTLLADALTTALFLVDAASLTRYYDFEYALIAADSTAWQSTAFPGEFFTAT